MDPFVSMLLLWIVSALVGYVLIREDRKAEYRRWTRGDRIVALSLALLYGPVLLIVVGLVGLVGKLSDSRWGRKEARW